MWQEIHLVAILCAECSRVFNLVVGGVITIQYSYLVDFLMTGVDVMLLRDLQ